MCIENKHYKITDLFECRSSSLFETIEALRARGQMEEQRVVNHLLIYTRFSISIFSANIAVPMHKQLTIIPIRLHVDMRHTEYTRGRIRSSHDRHSHATIQP